MATKSGNKLQPVPGVELNKIMNFVRSHPEPERKATLSKCVDMYLDGRVSFDLVAYTCLCYGGKHGGEWLREMIPAAIRNQEAEKIKADNLPKETKRHLIKFCMGADGGEATAAY